MSTEVFFKPIAHELPSRLRTGLDKKLLCSREHGPKVRRALFGPVNHVEALRILDEELARHSQACSKKWNFDFATETPLSAATRYTWTVISAAAAAAATTRPFKTSIAEAEAGNGTPSADDLYYGGEPRLDEDLLLRPRAMKPDEIAAVASVSKQPSTPTSHERNRPKTQQQRLMTDFMPAKKRSISSSSVKKYNKSPSLTARPSKIQKT